MDYLVDKKVSGWPQPELWPMALCPGGGWRRVVALRGLSWMVLFSIFSNSLFLRKSVLN